MIVFRLVSKNKVIHHHHHHGRAGGEEVFRKRKRRHYILYMMTSILVVTSLIIFIVLSRLANVQRDASSSSIMQSPGSNIVTTLLHEYTVNHHHHAKREQQSSTVVGQHQHQQHDEDADCPFRNSPIYRKVFVYPNHGDVENGWSGAILSENNNNNSNSTPPPWPWLEFDRMARQNGTSHYDITSTHVQYATELLVRQVMVHPKSCLRTYNPDEATLFYVPYLPSVEHHQGSVRINDYTTSPYGQAILDILEKGQYDAWEHWFGLTSKYWKRRNGSDHILVFSEPMHGLFHPKLKRGNFHYIQTQKQLAPPIVISVELSTTFVNMYPNCARKNILMPYPNTDGRWFNGYYEKMLSPNLTTTASAAMMASDNNNMMEQERRPASQYFSVGLHGTCTKLRKAMTSDYSCSSSYRFLQEQLLQVIGGHAAEQRHAAAVGMLLSTFCPCPGGDSPSAKRMFDAIFMGCIPIIISADFVWPFTTEFDTINDDDSQNKAAPPLLDPDDFSLRFLASDYNTLALDPASCQVLNETRSLGLQARLDAISATEIQRFRQGLQKARNLYSWYQPSKHLVDNPLRQGVLPDGGAAHALVQALAERANGVKWPACEQELKLLSPEREEPNRFKC